MPPAVKKPQDHKAKVTPDPRGKVTGKVFMWTTEDDATITIPLRINMGVLLEMDDGDMDAKAMMAMISKIAPGQDDVIAVTDVQDFMECFTAWQTAYNSRTGASLGEASASSA